MEFGLNLRSIHEPEKMADLAKLAEDNGFDYVYVSDSQALWRDVFVNLALIADRTDTIKMGPGVTNPVTRHPMVTANAILTVDELSDGRAFLGLGRGGSAVRAIGMEDLPSFAETEESIEIMKKFWRKEKQDFEVRHSTTTLHWSDGGSIPLYMAAAGPKMVRLSAEHGDGIMIAYVSHPPEVRRRVQAIEEVEPTETKKISYLTSAVSDTNEDAYRLVRPMVAAYCDLAPNLAKRCNIDLDLEKCRKLRERTGDLTHATNYPEIVESEQADFVNDDAVEKITISGTPETIRERVGELEEQGIEKLVMRPFFSHKFSDEKEYSLDYYIETWGEEVIPHFA